MGNKKLPTPNMASTRLSAEPARFGNIQPREVNTALHACQQYNEAWAAGWSTLLT